MKLSSVVVGIASMAALASAADDATREIVTVTVTGTTETHKYGRFDKTKESSSSTSTGTHKFDKTKGPLTTTVYVQPSGVRNDAVVFPNRLANGSNGTNGTNGTSGHSSDNAGYANSLNLGVAGAIAAGLAIII
ncbi:uncharacterized protein CANTADRAFT_8331 [Suhomyces tanzawaensis NRRL Y-17324]|uniref:Uncharacterized protein n=1 Tax=Suhomyces tanzawaensis NRRL Y-17324 TaxID=984487 RepID=A0A1E4SBF2_9ASCO|nr:uncharacterized protein CANTADRAFT_8331 [Suhomyces tanzawaensis NRRL Y-17324]ODV76732.1 hypothetical protein CANTADRAFT_8331 [Suhomyces tanzawaensis NRRL Y-17324]